MQAGTLVEMHAEAQQVLTTGAEVSRGVTASPHALH